VELFTGLVFVTLPLAFSYHIAHNLNHLVREGTGLQALLLNPLGTDTQALTMLEKHDRHFDMLISPGSNIRIFPQENRFRLESDGENLGFGPFEFTVLPRALKVVIGEKNF
jgi:diacylglycerol kinase family enzyme